MLGYIITLGQAPNTYTGFRAASDDMEVIKGELFVETLEGYTQVTCVSPQQKRQQLGELFGALPIESRVAFAPIAATVYTALDMGDIEMAIYFVTQAGKNPIADQDLISKMLHLLKG